MSAKLFEACKQSLDQWLLLRQGEFIGTWKLLQKLTLQVNEYIEDVDWDAVLETPWDSLTWVLQTCSGKKHNKKLVIIKRK